MEGRSAPGAPERARNRRAQSSDKQKPVMKDSPVIKAHQIPAHWQITNENLPQFPVKLRRRYLVRFKTQSRFQVKADGTAASRVGMLIYW